MFTKRSLELEIIDTGDYTAAEYERFLREIRFINRWLGDVTALKETLLREIENQNLNEFSVLDVGAGSGELLRVAAKFARRTNRKASLCGLELNARSAAAIIEESVEFPNIRAVRADALKLPFADNSFDYSFCSLFAHHFRDDKIVEILTEMRRVSRRRIFVIDLHRNQSAYRGYKLFSVIFRLGRLTRNDGALSILRGFLPDELADLGAQANLQNIQITNHSPARLVLRGE